MSNIECPECENSGMVSESPILEDSYECGDCLIAFNGDGEVTERA